MKEHTIEMLTDWILRHRNESVFVDDTKEQIALGIQQDVKNGNIIYAYDDNEMDFIGVVSFIVDNTNKIFFVRNILVTKHTALVQFINFFRAHWPGYHITANRRNSYVQYNTFRLCNLLTDMKTPTATEEEL